MKSIDKNVSFPFSVIARNGHKQLTMHKDTILAQLKSTGTSLLAKAEPGDTKHSTDHMNRRNTLPITEPSIDLKGHNLWATAFKETFRCTSVYFWSSPKGLHLLFRKVSWKRSGSCRSHNLPTVSALISIQEQQKCFFLEYGGLLSFQVLLLPNPLEYIWQKFFWDFELPCNLGGFVKHPLILSCSFLLNIQPPPKIRSFPWFYLGAYSKSCSRFAELDKSSIQPCVWLLTRLQVKQPFGWKECEDLGLSTCLFGAFLKPSSNLLVDNSCQSLKCSLLADSAFWPAHHWGAAQTGARCSSAPWVQSLVNINEQTFPQSRVYVSALQTGCSGGTGSLQQIHKRRRC